MSALDQLKPGLRVRGLVAEGDVTIIAIEQHGSDIVNVIFRAETGQISDRLLTSDEATRIEVASDRRWTFDADGAAFKLASEARRIELAHLFDPFSALEASTIDPLPHQIEAVYGRLLPMQPLRFLLADDPGAGKTIMSGLYIRELMLRGDLDRCLVIAPGSLVEQWQEELDQRFGLHFDIMSRNMVELARTGNPFQEENLLIARLDQLSRSAELQAKLSVTDWDLIIVDEAHKMSAHLYGEEVKRTLRFQLGELIRDRTRNLLLLTATPHNGSNEDFLLFLSLLDPDRFVGRLRKSQKLPDVTDLMRRYVKENLLTFDGKRLFTERRATTVNYDLSPEEDRLYEAVSSYVQEGMGRAQALEEGGDRRRGLAVGFALAALQRRLASSPQAIYRSLGRRKDKLEAQLRDALRVGQLQDATPVSGRLADPDGFDTDDFDGDEIKRRLKLMRAFGAFSVVHVFPDGPGDITDDDDGVHLVVLPITAHHLPNVDESPAVSMAREILIQRNAGPRLNRNMLVFSAATEALLMGLRNAARQYLAWTSILKDESDNKLELTNADQAQARSKISETDETVNQRITETYQHVLVPEQTPGTRDIRWHQSRPTGTGSLAERIAKKLEAEERLIPVYGGTRVRMDLDRIPLWTERNDVSVEALWKAYCQFLYLPRLASFEVLVNAISDGVSKFSWQSEAFAYAEGHDGERWVGLAAGQHVTARPGGYVVAPEAAKSQFDLEVAPIPEPPGGVPEDGDVATPTQDGSGMRGGTSGGTAGGGTIAALPTSFYGQFSLDTVRAIRQLEDILRNVVEQLQRSDGAAVDLTLEINAKSSGFDDQVRRTVKENATQLGAKGQEFE